MTLTIQVLAFAQLADELGWRRQAVTLDLDPPTVRAALDVVAGDHAAVAAMREHLAVAVNDRYVTSDHELTDGDEVALIPPVSGG